MPDEDIYRQSLQRIIDDQIELEDEETVLEQAKSADIELDDDNNVVDWEGNGEDAINRLEYQITGEKTEEPEEDEAEDDGDRQEYYLETIRDIVEEQKEFLGEDVAIKQARQAPLIIDADGNVEGFYGKGEDVLEILRSFTEHQEFYLTVIRRIVAVFNRLLGEQTSLKYARKAPLEIAPEGEVTAYYGKGRNALETLADQYEQVWGESVTYKKIREGIRDEIDSGNYKLLPEQMRPPKDNENGLSGIKRLINRLLRFIKNYVGLEDG